jgi:hypothetical protein
MPTLKFTQSTFYRRRAPRPAESNNWDSQFAGFGPRISAPRRGKDEETGRPTWQPLYRVSGKLVRETIGTVAQIPNVADARALASASMRKAQAGTHPVEEKRRSREDERRRVQGTALAAVARQRDTIENVVAEFMKRYMEAERTRRAMSSRRSGILISTCCR